MLGVGAIRLMMVLDDAILIGGVGTAVFSSFLGVYTLGISYGITSIIGGLLFCKSK
jgi:hypothetical protein